MNPQDEPGQTVPLALFAAARDRADKPVYSCRPSFDLKGPPPPLRTHTWREYSALVRQTAQGLIRMGLPFQGTVNIVASTRFEWTLIAHSVQAAGGIPVGIYPTCSPVETSYIIVHSEAKIVFVENKAQYDKLAAERSKLGHLQHIVIFDGSIQGDDRVMTWDAFIGLCRESNKVATLNQRMHELKPEHLAIFIYTSGTTGPPKGVMLTHDNVTWTTRRIASFLPSEEGSRTVAFLPLAHIAEQVFTLYLPFYSKNHVIFSAGMERLLDDLKEFQPTTFFAPPRIWEKFYAALSTKVPEGVPPAKLPAEVKRAMLTAVGMNQVVFPVTGAAPISAQILHFFNALGLTIYEVYGQSEDTGPTTINLPGKVKFGSVGPRIAGIDVRISDDGEILVHGRNVFKGYYKDEETTKATLRDGWLYSGDLGRFDEEGFLHITGRKKDIIITAGGKNITPINIENAIKSHPLVGDAVMIGDRRPYPVALVTLDVDVAGGICKAKGVSYEQLTKDPEIIQQVEKHIEKVNEDLAQVEKIKKFMILPRPFQIDKGEVTPTMKVKRSFINQAYAAEIERLYSISTARL
jgi:long-chain acyl-CoA synthetase